MKLLTCFSTSLTNKRSAVKTKLSVTSGRLLIPEPGDGRPLTLSSGGTPTHNAHLKLHNWQLNNMSHHQHAHNQPRAFTLKVNALVSTSAWSIL